MIVWINICLTVTQLNRNPLDWTSESSTTQVAGVPTGPTTRPSSFPSVNPEGPLEPVK